MLKNRPDGPEKRYAFHLYNIIAVSLLIQKWRIAALADKLGVYYAQLAQNRREELERELPDRLKKARKDGKNEGR